MKLKKPKKEVVVAIFWAIVTLASVVWFLLCAGFVNSEAPLYKDVLPTDEMVFGFAVAVTAGSAFFAVGSFDEFVCSIKKLRKGKVKTNEEKH